MNLHFSLIRGAGHGPEVAPHLVSFYSRRAHHFVFDLRRRTFSAWDIRYQSQSGKALSDRTFTLREAIAFAGPLVPDSFPSDYSQRRAESGHAQ